jgi:thiamine-phosphate pyrophosphorylase
MPPLAPLVRHDDAYWVLKVIRYYITDRRLTPTPLVEHVAGLVARNAIDWIQIREKDLSSRELAALTSAIVAIAKPAGVRVLVNERVDIAIASSADGVHLPSNAISPWKLRCLGIPFIGVSCHNTAELRAATEEGADFVVLSPVFQPLSKNYQAEALGLPLFEQLARSTSIPVLALGGVTRENAPTCIQAGAAGIAGITLFS